MDRSPYERLDVPGETNTELADRVESLDDGGYIIEPAAEQTCELCRINRYPFDLDEQIFYEDNEMYVVQTREMKGHTVRNMAVLKDHARIPDEEDKKKYLNRLRNVTASHIQQGEMLLFGSMQTFSDHWHAIACDLEGDDLEQIHDRERYQVNGRDHRKEEEYIESRAGELIL
ncbi:MAG: hypothetical protein SVU32_02415 [Candidatus Nanohaloarchaea archaeon]|nr:hypothetical protein [Candidatus Nanohaloarchaea archaeon]